MKAKVARLLKKPRFLKDGIASTTLHRDAHGRNVLFYFDAGQQLSEHTSTMAAELTFLSGTARVKLGRRTRAVGAGDWVHMPPRLPHAIQAETRVVMLLTLFPQSATDGATRKSA